jgi:predicted transcriptional regulator
MVKRSAPRPTDAELTILRVLWDRGPSTVRQVHKVISQDNRTGYTTTLKLLQIMMEKGLVLRDESDWPHLYRPASTEEKTQKQLLSDLLDRAFAGSAGKLVLRALSTAKVSAQEREEIKKLLDELEGKPS